MESTLVLRGSNPQGTWPSVFTELNEVRSQPKSTVSQTWALDAPGHHGDLSTLAVPNPLREGGEHVLWSP